MQDNDFRILEKWICTEKKRIKRNKLVKIYCKYMRIHFSGMTQDDVEKYLKSRLSFLKLKHKEKKH